LARELPQRVHDAVRWETGLVVALVAVISFGVLVSSQFLTAANVFYLNLSIGEVAIMTLPMTLIIVTGEIDLSVASILGLSSALLGDLVSHGWSVPAAMAAVLVAGTAAGVFNGFLITRVGLPSLAVTIGTLTLYRGIAVVILGPSTISAFPARYTDIGVTPFPHTGGYLSYSVVIFIVLAIIFGVVLHATPFGRSLFVMGSNVEAARFAGIRVKRTKLLLFAVSGLVCALAGILYTFRLSTAVQDNGLGLELNVVTIVLLGGVSIFGGRGTIVGVVLAIGVFAGLQNALFLTDFNQQATGVVTGGLLLVSVLIPNVSSYVRRARTFLKRRHLRGALGSLEKEPAA
jgi:rhamnose transport system permease protein